MSAAHVELGTRAFLAGVRASADEALRARGLAPEWRQRFGFLQASFGQPGLHHEVWLQRPRRQVEVGLHFEADAELNGWLLRRFAAEMPAVWAALGPAFELEQWTSTWGRIHAYLPFGVMDEALVRRSAGCLVDCIADLQPRLEALLAERGHRR
jgi:hypothetical protein